MPLRRHHGRLQLLPLPAPGLGDAVGVGGQFLGRKRGGNLTEFRFNTEAIAHLFCKTCGIETFARGSDGKGKALVMINVHYLEDAPAVDSATITHWDGANW